MPIYNLQFTIYNEFSMLDKIISYSFYLLFFLTPLFWTSQNFELFEYNKMILTYGITVVIVGAWLLKTINDKRLTIKHTPLDIPLLLFLLSQILSTIFSIDPHTSIWGYYSRSNGGLLSIVSYILLYWAYVSNMDWARVKTTLKFGLLAGAIISWWAILEHFGISPSCVILRGEFNASCWIQDVQARVFATLGQPNWLAAYLAMLIFPALYFFSTATTRLTLTTYYLLLTTYYLAFTFTYSRGPTLGLIGGMVVFTLLLSFPRKSKIPEGRESILYGSRIKYGMTVLLSFLFINILFGSALTSFRLVSRFAPPPRPTISLTPTSVTQLESGGTESGQIRFIVWRGALDIFKHYPIFGSGVETFAYSYYQFRPAAHNLTSEWDFLYNKAHNEYLNYLATTGLVGFLAYVFLIGSFLVWSIKYVVIARSEGGPSKRDKQSLLLTRSPRSATGGPRDDGLLILTIIASYISYLVYNFFLFSVVIIAIFFYLFPALAFVATSSIKPLKIPSTFHSLYSIFQLVYRRALYTKIAKGIIIFSILYLLYSIFQSWLSDTLFAKGERASDLGNPGRAYNFLSTAVELNRGEPFYRSELSFAAASASVALQEQDATLSALLKDQAVAETENVLRGSPKNVSFLRTAIRTYFELSTLDKKYTDKTLETLEATISLAPTDPKLYYNKALVLDSIGKRQEAILSLQKAIQLKPNYVEALHELQEATASSKP